MHLCNHAHSWLASLDVDTVISFYIFESSNSAAQTSEIRKSSEGERENYMVSGTFGMWGVAIYL